MTSLLQEAIERSPLIPRVQKKVLKAICSHSFPLAAKELEEELGLSRPSVSFALKTLLERKFVNRVKDSVYLYSPNTDKIKEIEQRYMLKINKH